MVFKKIILIFLLLLIHCKTYELYSYNSISIQQIILIEADIVVPKKTPTYHLEYMYMVGLQNNIPPRILFRLIYKESTFNANVKSDRGAYGYMQIMPHIAKHYAAKLNISKHKWKSNIIIGTTLLNEYYQYWFKRKKSEKVAWRYALASYNYGITNVIDNGIPTSGETHEFIKFILK